MSYTSTLECLISKNRTFQYHVKSKSFDKVYPGTGVLAQVLSLTYAAEQQRTLRLSWEIYVPMAGQVSKRYIECKDDGFDWTLDKAIDSITDDILDHAPDAQVPINYNLYTKIWLTRPDAGPLLNAIAWAPGDDELLLKTLAELTLHQSQGTRWWAHWALKKLQNEEEKWDLLRILRESRK